MRGRRPGAGAIGRGRLVAAVAVACLAAAPAAALAQAGPQSAAVALAATFRAAGVMTTLPPTAAVSVASSQTFDTTQEAQRVDQSLIIAPGDPPPTLFVSGQGLSSQVSTATPAPGARQAEGRGAAQQVRVILAAASSLGQAAADKAPALAIEARQLTASAFFKAHGSANGYALGLANVGSLSISGVLVGGSLRPYSGKMTPNLVIFRSPQVTITLNRQIRSAPTVECDEEACDNEAPALGAPALRVVAIDVELHDALVGTTKVSGHIRFNQATVQ